MSSLLYKISEFVIHDSMFANITSIRDHKELNIPNLKETCMSFTFCSIQSLSLMHYKEEGVLLCIVSLCTGYGHTPYHTQCKGTLTLGKFAMSCARVISLASVLWPRHTSPKCAVAKGLFRAGIRMAWSH